MRDPRWTHQKEHTVKFLAAILALGLIAFFPTPGCWYLFREGDALPQPDALGTPEFLAMILSQK
jgi:hypothetical protein